MRVDARASIPPGRQLHSPGPRRRLAASPPLRPRSGDTGRSGRELRSSSLSVSPVVVRRARMPTSRPILNEAASAVMGRSALGRERIGDAVPASGSSRGRARRAVLTGSAGSGVIACRTPSAVGSHRRFTGRRRPSRPCPSGTKDHGVNDQPGEVPILQTPEALSGAVAVPALLVSAPVPDEPRREFRIPRWAAVAAVVPSTVASA